MLRNQVRYVRYFEKGMMVYFAKISEAISLRSNPRIRWHSVDYNRWQQGVKMKMAIAMIPLGPLSLLKQRKSAEI